MKIQGVTFQKTVTFIFTAARASYLTNSIWCRLQIMKLFITQLSPVSCFTVPLRSKHSPKDPFLRTYISVYHTLIFISVIPSASDIRPCKSNKDFKELTLGFHVPYADSAFGCLRKLDVGNHSGVSEVHAVSIFRAEVSRATQCLYIYK
jgi:hypothetical protein